MSRIIDLNLEVPTNRLASRKRCATLAYENILDVCSDGCRDQGGFSGGVLRSSWDTERES